MKYFLRWRPFRRSAYARESVKDEQTPVPTAASNLNVGEIRNKKFFKALVKPKVSFLYEGLSTFKV